MENLVIGIEGHVGAGKTAICKELLNKIPNSILLQGGNLYRGIAYALLRSGTNLEELKPSMKQADIKQIMEKLKIPENHSGVSKTLRLPEDIVDNIQNLANLKNLSFNKIVISLLDFGLTNLDEKDKEELKKMQK